MTMKFCIAGWEAKGLRCPDHKMDFLRKDHDVYPISLIQMPNGVGKTTTLNLLRAALSGDAAAWSREFMFEFRRVPAKNDGLFVIHLLINDKRYSISMIFNFGSVDDNKIITYKTTWPSGEKTGFSPPQIMDRFLQPDFVKLFVFDGELAEQLLENTSTNADTAIENLFQLNKLNGMSHRIEEYWNSHAQSSGASSVGTFNKHKKKVKELKGRIKKLSKEKEEKVAEHERIHKLCLKLKKDFNSDIKRNKELKDKMDKAEDDLSNANSEVSSCVSKMLSELREPHGISMKIANDLVSFKSMLDRVKLPESTAKEFFKELAEEDECICGRTLDPESRTAIISRAGRYLGSNDMQLLNSMKSDIDNYVTSDTSIAFNNLVNTNSCLTKSIAIRNKLKTTRNAFRENAVDDNPELKQIQEDIHSLTLSEGKLLHEIEQYDESMSTDGKSDKEVYCIRVLQNRLDKAELDLASISNTREIKRKYDILKKIIEQSVKTATLNLSEGICKETNKRIMDLMPDNSIRLKEIHKCLVLRDQGGGSVGETLLVAYAFLATLFNRKNEYSLPFVVDSPANSIDLEKRRPLGQLVPKLTDQFIAFTMSSEREGFLQSLEEHTEPNDIQYLTMFRLPAAQREKDAAQMKTFKTENGMCVHDKDYFKVFQIDKGEE